MLLSNGALVGSKHPAFEQGDHTVNSGQQMDALFQGALNVTLVFVSLHLSISIESVGYDGAAFLDALDDKAVQALALGIWNTSQAYAPNSLAVLLSGDRDQAFGVCKPPGCSIGFFCTPLIAAIQNFRIIARRQKNLLFVFGRKLLGSAESDYRVTPYCSDQQSIDRSLHHLIHPPLSHPLGNSPLTI